MSNHIGPIDNHKNEILHMLHQEIVYVINTGAYHLGWYPNLLKSSVVLLYWFPIPIRANPWFSPHVQREAVKQTFAIRHFVAKWWSVKQSCVKHMLSFCLSFYIRLSLCLPIFVSACVSYYVCIFACSSLYRTFVLFNTLLCYISLIYVSLSVCLPVSVFACVSYSLYLCTFM